ncbi:MAG TPA: hypothetical protein VEV17_11825 [Bryobacteraceae bacterium]|nr:hypothetical protein [Bryobacteraceae bacterium]
MDHLELSQQARDRIEAAELSAQNIFEGFQLDRDSLVAMAYEMGVSPSELDFAPGNAVLQVANSKGIQGRELAADHLFRVTSVEYWRLLKPNVEAFITKLGTIWQWAYQRFQVNIDLTESCKRDWRAWALRERAAAGLGKPDQSDTTQPDIKAVFAKLTPTVAQSADEMTEIGPAFSERPSDAPDPSDTDRGKIRSAWLDTTRVAKVWTSDLDIQNNGGPTYNTIQRFRSGKKSTRDDYVRARLAKAFGCKISEVPK